MPSSAACSASQSAPSRPGAAMTAVRLDGRAVGKLDAGDPLVARQDAARRDLRADVDALLGEVHAHRLEHDRRAVGAQVADGHGHELHARERGLALQRRRGRSVRTVDLVSRAELEPQVVRVADQLCERRVVDEVGQPAAHLGGERELAVRERARPAPAGHDVAGAAAHAGGLARRTAPLGDGVALLDDQDALDPRAGELECREDAGGAGADDDDVVAVRHEAAPFDESRPARRLRQGTARYHIPRVKIEPNGSRADKRPKRPEGPVRRREHGGGRSANARNRERSAPA